jgi:hypothetical protein
MYFEIKMSILDEFLPSFFPFLSFLSFFQRQCTEFHLVERQNLAQKEVKMSVKKKLCFPFKGTLKKSLTRNGPLVKVFLPDAKAEANGQFPVSLSANENIHFIFNNMKSAAHF